MIAVIYARKSTDQSGVADDAKSVRRQIEHARAYAARHGWTVRDEYVFVDDGISGAEFANRPGFVRLMSALRPAASFQVLVMSEESRLGREAIETAYALKQLIIGGVRIFFYLEDRERTFDSPTDKLLMSVTAFADELEREKARQRTYDAMQRKAKAGHVTGGRVFGYENVEVLGPDGSRSHVERRITEAEAAVVRRIFDLCAEGAGLTRITKALNADGVPAPRPQRGRPVGWAHTTVRDVLLRDLYRGVIVWNQTRKRHRWGQHRQHARREQEWIRLPAPRLQIVSDELWAAAHARLDARRRQFEQAHAVAARSRDVEARYLLAGFGRCAICGGGWLGHTRDHGRQRVKFYGCATHWKRGARVCRNGMVARVEAIDAEVLATLADNVLRPAVITEAIAIALDELAPDGNGTRTRRQLEAELQRVTDECGRLAEAIGRGGRLTALLERLTRLEGRAEAIREELALFQAAPVVDRIALERRLRTKLADWRGLLTRNLSSGRQMLRLLLGGPIRFTAVDEERRRGYRFEGTIALDRMSSGLVATPLPLIARCVAAEQSPVSRNCPRPNVHWHLTCSISATTVPFISSNPDAWMRPYYEAVAALEALLSIPIQFGAPRGRHRGGLCGKSRDSPADRRPTLPARLLSLSNVVYRSPAVREVELRRVRKDSRELRCLAFYLPTGTLHRDPMTNPAALGATR